MSFERCVRHHLVLKHDLSSYLWKRHHVLFLIVLSVTAYNNRIVISGIFFSLSPAKKEHNCPLFFFNFCPHSFDFYFIFITFITILFVFNLILQLQFLIHFFFSFQSLFFLFLIYFLCPFVKILLDFNFIFQSKFFVLPFSISILIFFYLFLFFFIKVLFFFQLSPSIKISHMFFLFWSLFFLFLIYFLGPFINVLFAFNFIL
jgi:hypothetical protein